MEEFLNPHNQLLSSFRSTCFVFEIFLFACDVKCMLITSHCINSEISEIIIVNKWNITFDRSVGNLTSTIILFWPKPNHCFLFTTQLYCLQQLNVELEHYALWSIYEQLRLHFSCRNVDRSQLKPIVHIAPIPTNESQFIHLVAITQSGKWSCMMN